MLHDQGIALVNSNRKQVREGARKFPIMAQRLAAERRQPRVREREWVTPGRKYLGAQGTGHVRWGREE